MCVEFRFKLSRDTGVSLTVAVCEALLDEKFTGEGGSRFRVTPGSST